MSLVWWRVCGMRAVFGRESPPHKRRGGRGEKSTVSLEERRDTRLGARREWELVVSHAADGKDGWRWGRARGASLKDQRVCRTN